MMCLNCYCNIVQLCFAKNNIVCNQIKVELYYYYYYRYTKLYIRIKLNLKVFSVPIVEFSMTRLRRGCFLSNSASTCVGSHVR